MYTDDCTQSIRYKPCCLLVCLLIVTLSGCRSDVTDASAQTNTPSASQLKTQTIFYKRFQEDYATWQLTLADTQQCPLLEPLQAGNLPYEYIDLKHGAAFVVEFVSDTQNCVQFSMQQQGQSLALSETHFTVSLTEKTPIYLYQDDIHSYTKPKGAFGYKAHWLHPEFIALPNVRDGLDYQLWVNTEPMTSIQATPVQRYSLTPSQRFSLEAWPHLRDYQVFSIEGMTPQQAKADLKGDIWLVGQNQQEETVMATRVQIAPVLDALYGHAAGQIQLGATQVASSPRIHLWAPTARYVHIQWKTDTNSAIQKAPMIFSSESGVWAFSDPSLQIDSAYRFVVDVFHPKLEKYIQETVTDPYSVALSADQNWSLIVDLTQDPALQPLGWQTFQPKVVASLGEHVAYEVHVRDFSALDAQCDVAYRGKYLAFTDPQCLGVHHLERLAQAGMNTIHLLPTYNIASIHKAPSQRFTLDERRDRICALAAQHSIDTPLCQEQLPNEPLISLLENFPIAYEQASKWLSPLSALDSYNWGYDPIHYGVPESSYATSQDPKDVIREFRAMVMALNQRGYKVVLDAVFNHSAGIGLEQAALLDKIVPTYYYRLERYTGTVFHSTCCANIATEHQLVEKLISDMMLHWVEHYGVGGFRVDLMGHHPALQMQRIRTRLEQVRPDIWLFGEGWDFGEVAGNARFVNASQTNMAGSGIGTFNDRLRDGIRGTRFGDVGETLLTRKGFANAWDDDQTQSLQKQMAWVRLGMVGNLADYPLPTPQGIQLGRHLSYGGVSAGYAQEPFEIINYVSNHDNLTLWDINQFKLPVSATPVQRMRAQLVALAPVIFGQGVAYFHMGSDFLRSKSADRDSYNSGDWFNRVDFSLTRHFWGQSLPPWEVNRLNYTQIQQRFRQANIVPSAQEIQFAHDEFLRLLAIRQTSRLFGRWDRQQVIENVHFRNANSLDYPRLIVMEVMHETDGSYIFAINPYPESIESYMLPQLSSYHYHIHPLLWSHPRSPDMQLLQKKLSLPGQSIAVFIQ